MEVGDDFLLPLAPGSPPSNLQSRIHSAARGWGIRVRTKAVEGGVRVWRIA